MRVLTAAQMREVDKYMIETMAIPSLLLMENAAAGVADVLMETMEPCVVHVFCGTGNNGGDGLAVARILLANGYDVYVAIAGRESDMTEDTAANFAMFAKIPERALCFGEMSEFWEWDIPEADAVVDALFGTGLSRDVTGLQEELIDHINEAGSYTVAVDIPSGIRADKGDILGTAVLADATVTFQYPKPGHFLFPGRDYVGDLHIVKIGVDDGCDTLKQRGISAYTGEGEGLALPARAADTHKGDYGKLLLVAGSRGMAGAAVLAARAASRAGAGLVTVGAVEAVVDVMQQSVPEVTCRVLAGEDGGLVRNSLYEIERIAKGKTAMAIGPGLGVGQEIQDVVAGAVRVLAMPIVIDADGLNALEGKAEVLRERKDEVVLTPHPREFARLSDMDMETVLDDPLGCARSFAKEYGVTVLLKGATSVVAGRDGRAALIASGTPGMAKGGSGDVLTGLIGGLLAQGIPAYDAAVLGAYIAGAAGEIAVAEMGEYSMTPMDEVNCIGIVMKKLVEHGCGCGCGGHHGHTHEHNSHARQVERKPEEELPEKTAEEALAQIEEIERTQEMRKITPEEAEGESSTRRRIG